MNNLIQLDAVTSGILGVVIMLVVGALLGLGLAFSSIKLQVKEDERLKEVVKMLPGYNCGSCGYPGCSGLAEAVLKGEVKTLKTCRPSKPEQRTKIKEYLASTPGPDGNTLNVND
jgi:electron transport complex protein RnfB